MILRTEGTWTTEAKRGERALRRAIQSDLAAWARHALQPQGLAPARHHLVLTDALADVAAGRTDRLMVLMPPGSAKSTYASLLFPPWFLSRHPRAHVIAASHTAGLAEGFGRGVRGLILEHGPRLGLRLDPGSRAAGRFAVGRGGSYYAVGVRGPVTGRRADLLLIDDPVKGQLEADSPRLRDAAWDWYRSDLVTRLRPGGRIVLVMTRWHLDDLGGRLLEAHGQGGEPWRVIRLPALAEPGDPLGRAPGEALWPEWEGTDALERKRLALGDRAFAALFQQSPVRAGGGLFQAGRIGVADALLPGPAVRAWDLAATEGGGDWTAGVRLAAGDSAWQVQGRGAPAGRAGGGGDRHTPRRRPGRAERRHRPAAGPRPGRAITSRLPHGPAGGLARGQQPGNRGEGGARHAGGEPGQCRQRECAAGGVEPYLPGRVGCVPGWAVR